MKELEGDGPNKDVSSAVQAVVDWFGPTDMLKWKEQFKEQPDVKPGLDPDSGDGIVARLIGGAIQENKDKAEMANPIHYITKDAAPFLIMHGDKDPLVPLGQSRMLDEALKAAKVESTLVVIKGDGHGGAGFVTVENLQKIVDFFDKHLKTESRRLPLRRPRRNKRQGRGRSNTAAALFHSWRPAPPTDIARGSLFSLPSPPSRHAVPEWRIGECRSCPPPPRAPNPSANRRRRLKVRAVPSVGAALVPLRGSFRCSRCCFTVCAGCEAFPMGTDPDAGDC